MNSISTVSTVFTSTHPPSRPLVSGGFSGAVERPGTPKRAVASTERFLAALAVGIASLAAGNGTVAAGTVYLPNASFESPGTEFVDPRIDHWQKTPKPFWYDESQGYLWSQLTGVFANPAAGSADRLENMDGNQAVFLFAVPQVGIFQDYTSVGGTNSTPDRAFHARFESGKSYHLTAGIRGGGGGMTNGVTLQVGLYYLDAATNQVTIASTNIVYTPEAFTNATRFVDFTVAAPAVRSGDAWAGRNIGVSLISTVDPALAGGYWDIDQVRLTETLEIPNASFENPATDFVDPFVGSWQKTPKPFWYDESGGYLWTQLTGAFANPAAGSADRTENMDGNQAVFLFAVPEVGLFQDYESIGGTNTAPERAFDAVYQVGRAYTLTFGVLGGGGNMVEGVSLEAGLYYRDGASNRVTVASTNLVYHPALFTNAENKKLFVDFQVQVPAVKPGDPWAGQHLGVQFRSTVRPDLAGGYWDLDHVRLFEVREPVLADPVRTGEQFTFTVLSEPGLNFEILSAPTVALPTADWTRLGTITNLTGATPFVDPAPGSSGRFYRARQLP
ncbi:MAG: hypothetical protein ACYDC1_19795 [Limisphaerales bacterium]